ncbi:glycosyltransferase [Paenibacillus antri]|uniref:Glycosyltransferase n=1 Tax=Paenibacillus antri TaxID=2582848 RepID=A0A5R9GJ21_9BACL|nr:glycosyltransferase [Paenibacillus antri]TLS53474.1 glycosyltransferase [Paenibacillus antri]
MKRIAFVRLRYLPPSETFIYGELRRIRTVKPIVFARKRMNLKRFPYKKIKRLPNRPSKIVRAFRRRRVRLIHARFGNAGVSLLPVKRRLRIPMLTSFHGFDLPAKRSPRKAYHRKLPELFRAGEKFTVPSRHMKHKLIRWGCPRHKIKIMYSGIDLVRFPYVEREPRTEGVTVVGVGRLHKKKGFRYLVKAFRQVLEKHPTSRLVIIGEGEEGRRLKRLIRKWKLQDRVRLRGHIRHDKLTDLLRRADIFCLPSLTTKDGNQEGIPNSIKEAMATGLPVVSTKHGGIPELVGNGVEGILVPERSVKRLAEGLIALIEQPALREEMGRNGRAKVERRFDAVKQVKRLEDIYRRLLRKGR